MFTWLTGQLFQWLPSNIKNAAHCSFCVILDKYILTVVKCKLTCAYLTLFKNYYLILQFAFISKYQFDYTDTN